MLKIYINYLHAPLPPIPSGAWGSHDEEIRMFDPSQNLCVHIGHYFSISRNSCKHKIRARNTGCSTWDFAFDTRDLSGTIEFASAVPQARKGEFCVEALKLWFLAERLRFASGDTVYTCITDPTLDSGFFVITSPNSSTLFTSPQVTNSICEWHKQLSSQFGWSVSS